MSMPFARMSLVVASAAVTVATLPPLFALATSQLSAPLLAAEQSGQEQPGIPFSFPSRQNGSGLEILDIATSDGHVCGSFDVQNVSTTPIERVRFIGVIEYRAPSTRPVQIVESDWIAGPLAPGTRSRLRADLFDAAVARQANGDERVQAFCAVREVTFTNGARWGVLPNARAIRARDVLNDDRPTLPRALVGQTHVLSASKQMLCLDEKGAEYSAGAQVAIREAPDRAARCSATGHWTEVNAATGEPLTAATSAANVVTLELTVEGVTPPLQLKSTTGSVATVQVPGGRTWGVVPSAGADGGVAVALHDMSARPDRLIGTRTLRPGESTRFPDLSPALSIRLVPE